MQMKKWVRKLSIKKKLLFYSYLIITPILLLISAGMFLRNYEETFSQVNTNHMQMIQSLADSVDVMCEDVRDICTYISITDEIINVLRPSKPKELNYFWKLDDNIKMIHNIIALKGSIKTIAIYPENGVNPYLSCIDGSAYVADVEQVRATEEYQRAVESKGKVVWTRESKEDTRFYETNRFNKLILYREIYDLSKKNALGYLVIGASEEPFLNLCKNVVSQPEETIVVFSATGNMLFYYGQMEETIIADIESQLSGLLEQKLFSGELDHYDDYQVFYCKNKKEGNIVCKITPKIKWSNYLNQIVAQPLLMLIGVLIALFPILILVSNLVTKPLQKLGAAMGQFRQGDFSQQMEVLTQDEVGELAAGFNEMVTSIKTLIDNNYILALNEKESELRALQAQINPHFLYNTLDSLYWQAQEAGNEEIAEDVYALSELFRLVLGKGSSIVTVKAETELVERYLHIQKMRFAKHLNYRIEISEQILDYRIPKLIIQPFVENAVVHGFEKKAKDFLLIVSGAMENGYLYFEIIDTGIGMTKEQLNDVWSSDDNKKYASQRIGRYAIKNIRERLSIKYQDDFALEIDSELGTGTAVKIRIPAEKQERLT